MWGDDRLSLIESLLPSSEWNSTIMLYLLGFQITTRSIHTLHWRYLYGWIKMDEILTISWNALKVRCLVIPKEHSPSIVSQPQLVPFIRVPSIHFPVKEYGIFFLSLSLSLLRFLSVHSSRPTYPSTTLSIQQLGCLNAQVLFVHSVHTHVCQEERLQCSITALTAREHHRQKPEPFAFYVVFLKF